MDSALTGGGAIFGQWKKFQTHIDAYFAYQHNVVNHIKHLKLEQTFMWEKKLMHMIVVKKRRYKHNRKWASKVELYVIASTRVNIEQVVLKVYSAFLLQVFCSICGQPVHKS